MSNYYDIAKKPDGKEYETVEMIDNYFGSHEYGVKFLDGEIYREDECEFGNLKKSKKLEDLIKKIERLKEETRQATGAYKYDFAYDEVIELIKKQ